MADNDCLHICATGPLSLSNSMICEIRLSDNANAGIKHRNNYNKPDWNGSFPQNYYFLLHKSHNILLYYNSYNSIQKIVNSL